MSRTGVGCRVVIDGAQVDDGCMDWNNVTNALPYGMTADDGLKVTWGRSTSVDQPESNSCTFRLFDDTQASYFNALRIGSEVRVIADAMISGGGTLPAFVDPDFEREVRAVTRNATVTRSQRRVETGVWSAQISPRDAALTYVSQFPPGEIQEPGTNPNAWDGLPHLGPGQTWHLSVRVWVPEGVLVTARPLVYAGPYAADVTVGAPIGDVFGGGWQTIEADVSPGVQYGWLGVQIDASGGLRWLDMGAATWAQTVQAWSDFSDVFLDRITILAPPEGSQISILVFGGRISDMRAEYQTDAPVIEITAVDFLGDLGNRFVGDEPWLVEPLRTRFLRVLALAHAAGEQQINADIATTLGAVPMTWEDIDRRAASGLLADMANSVDGVLWSATHIVSGPYVRLEDPGNRAPLYQLRLVNNRIVIAPTDPATLPPDQQPVTISACDVLRDPVRFVNDVSDIATRSTIDWQEQTVDDDGKPSPTTRTYTQIIPEQEISVGTRNISVQTLLTTEADAARIAERLLTRLAGQWRMEGLAVTDEDFDIPDLDAIRVLLALLDGVRRGGLPILVTDLPDWSPLGDVAPAYLEGGEYTYSGGGWQCALTVSRATGLGANATWDSITPTWTWDQWSRSITPTQTHDFVNHFQLFEYVLINCAS